MAREIVVVTINGIPFGSWQSFTASGDADSPERTCQVTGSIEAGVALTFKEGDPCTVASNGDLLITGHVTKIRRQITNQKIEITLDIRSKGSDMLKGSVDHKTHEWRDNDIVQIATDADPSGTKYTTDESLKKIKVARANVGQTVAAFVGKYVRKQRLFMVGEADGSVKFTRHGKHRHAGGIIEGDNLFEGTVETSEEERFGEYKVKGHEPDGTGEASFRYEEKAEDATVRKGPVKVLTPRVALSREEARNVANHAADSRHGESVTLECTLQGFRDQAGVLWQSGWLVHCVIPSCVLDQDLAIKTWTFSQDETKSEAKLSLVHPSALGGSQGGSSGKPSKSTGFSAR